MAQLRNYKLNEDNLLSQRWTHVLPAKTSLNTSSLVFPNFASAPSTPQKPEYNLPLKANNSLRANVKHSSMLKNSLFAKPCKAAMMPRTNKANSFDTLPKRDPDQNSDVTNCTTEEKSIRTTDNAMEHYLLRRRSSEPLLPLEPSLLNNQYLSMAELKPMNKFHHSCDDLRKIEQQLLRKIDLALKNDRDELTLSKNSLIEILSYISLNDKEQKRQLEECLRWQRQFYLEHQVRKLREEEMDYLLSNIANRLSQS
jgi:hypothetical protein